MTTQNPTYRLQRKLSVEKGCDNEDDEFPFRHSTPKHHQFYTEKAISFHSKKKGLPQNDENNHVKFPSGIKFFKEEALSVLDEHERLEYSSTDQLSEISHTLAGLGARSGHSFQKENLQISLSSEIQDIEQENMMLRKKMNEMKKELREYRQIDDKMLVQIKSFRDKAEEEEEKVKALKKQVQLQTNQIKELETELEGKEGRIQQLQSLLVRRDRRMSDGKVSIMVEEVENYKELIRQYEDEIQQLKNYYEKQLFQNQKKYTTIIQDINKKFDTAKVIGQRQINELLVEVKEKTEEISKLRNKLAHFDFKCKMPTLVSEDISSKDPKDPNNLHKYAIRFAKFSQFIDERIHKSCGKDKKQPTYRVSKSAVQGQAFPSTLQDFREKVPNSPESPSNNQESLLNMMGTKQRAQKLRRQPHEFWMLS